MNNDLYSKTLMDHMREPLHRAELSDEDVSAQGRNPLCGDEIRLALTWDGERLSELRWDGKACGVCSASASLMGDVAAGWTREGLAALAAVVVDWIEGRRKAAPGPDMAWELLEGVKGFPMRAKCASLPWTVLGEGVGRGGD